MIRTLRELIRKTEYSKGMAVLLAVVTMVAIVVLAGPATAAGDLDPTFSGDGKQTTNFGPDEDQGEGVAIQADGKVVVAGHSYNGNGYDFAVARYNTDGSPDTTFASTGRLTTAIGAGDALAYDVAIQADGKIVVAGYANDGTSEVFAVVRYETNGALDTTFDGDGRVTTDFGPKIDEAFSVAIQPLDDKIVVVGQSDQGTQSAFDYDFAVARYDVNGALDTTFTTDIGGSTTDAALDVTIQPSDGKIVAAGGANFFGFALVRYDTNGVPDTTFGGDGTVTTDFGGGSGPGDGASGVAIQPDGKIVAVGHHRDGVQGDFALARYNSTDGSLDTSFDGDGKLITAIGPSFDFAEDVAVRPDGKIVAGGYSYNGNNNDFAVTRYETNGALDTSFSGDGITTTDFGSGSDQARGVALQTDDKIVAAGNSGTSQNFAVARYLAEVPTGTVRAWGYNYYGQLGDGTMTNRTTPVQVKDLNDPTGFLVDVAAMAGGQFHSLALKNDGTVWAWGHNKFGKLGDGTTTKRTTPVQVKDPNDPTGFLTDVKAIAAGANHGLALKNDGTVWAWGSNGSGQLGDGTTTDRSTPVQVNLTGNIVDISGGSVHSLGLKDDGTVWAWGSNGTGQLGDGSTTTRKTPVQVKGENGVGFLTDVKDVATGASHSLALKNNGTVRAWGQNSSGKLGDGTTTNRKTPVQVKGENGAGSLTAIDAIAGGVDHSLALKNDGTVRAWGSNGSGQLGDGSTTTRKTPVQVSFLTDVKAIAGGQRHNQALKNDGTVWSWGWNANGRLGDGSTTTRKTPVQVKGENGVGFLINIKAIAEGGSKRHGIAIE